MDTNDTFFPEGGAMTPEIEARILAWVCGEASAAEARELDHRTAERPEWAAFKRRMESAAALVGEAVARDREPLRLSPRRRNALLKNLMPRQNLMIGFAISVALIAGVAVYGERTHYVPPIRSAVEADPPVSIHVVQDDPIVDDLPDQKPIKTDVSPPILPDAPPITIAPNAFLQPIEPPPGPPTPNTTVIPVGRGGDGNGIHAYLISQLDEPPSATYRARVEYPYSMRHNGISGQVMVDFIVDPRGVVRNAKAVNSSNVEFEDAAVNAVSRWKFRPGRRGGLPVYVHMQVPIVFSLDADGN